jgi:acyl-CoA synthetase (AMP-forming)/AMP-acid ligase II
LVPQVVMGSSRGGAELLPEEIHEDDVALIPFTSGTVGLPNGVMITHGNLISSPLKEGYILSRTQVLQSRELGKTVIAASLFHVLPLQRQLIPCVFMEKNEVQVSFYQLQEIGNLFARDQVNIFVMTPAMYWMHLHKTFLKIPADALRREGWGE